MNTFLLFYFHGSGRQWRPYVPDDSALETVRDWGVGVEARDPEDALRKVLTKDKVYSPTPRWLILNVDTGQTTELRVGLAHPVEYNIVNPSEEPPPA